jgi:hypothetical protein
MFAPPCQDLLASALAPCLATRSVRDPASGTELCQFRLDDVPQAERAAHSSVVMMAVTRGEAGRVRPSGSRHCCHPVNLPVGSRHCRCPDMLIARGCVLRCVLCGYILHRLAVRRYAHSGIE